MGRLLTLCCRLANHIIKRSYWYRQLFSASYGEIIPLEYAWEVDSQRNFDVMVLGSSSSYWAFDSSCGGIKWLKLARRPQKMINDYRWLRFCHSFLKEGGVVIVGLCPFSSVNIAETEMDLLRYMKVFFRREGLIPHGIYSRAKNLADNPIKFGLPAVKAGLRVLFHVDKCPVEDNRPSLNENTMSSKQLEDDALCWIRNWKKEFNIADLEYPLTEEHEFGRNEKVFLLRKIVDFCKERGYRPIVVIPPVTKYLSKYFTPRFREVYIDSFIRETNRDVKVFDYLMDEALSDETLYFNSFFLNKRGRRIFTERVLTDIGLR